MKITNYTIRMQYTSVDGGDSNTFTIDLVNVPAFDCDVSEFGKKVGDRVQRTLDAHSTGAAKLRKELTDLKAQQPKNPEQQVVEAAATEKPLGFAAPPKKKRGRPPKKRN